MTLCALTADPELLTVASAPGAPLTTPRWARRAAPPHTETPREQLAPGVWIVRHRRWVSPGELDTAAALPGGEDVEVREPRYMPPAWHRRALCGRLPLDLADALFFGVEGRLAPEHLIVATKGARRICAQCPVRRECLTASLENREAYGVWAGISGRQRQRLFHRLDEGESVADLVDECLRNE